MSKTKTVGTKLDIATAFGATKSFTAASNATECVLSMATGHSLAVNDYVEILTCDWGSLQYRVARIKTVATDDVTLEAVDTSNTNRFPAGTITGTLREISTWTRIDNRSRDFNGGGGELRTADISDLDDFDDRELPVSRSPATRSFPGYHDIGRAWVSSVRSASDNSDTPVPARELYGNGAILVYAAYWSFAEVPTPQDSTLRDRIDLRLAAPHTAYAS